MNTRGAMHPLTWTEEIRSYQFPADLTSSFSDDGEDSEGGSSQDHNGKDLSKRGRPRADAISSLVQEGSSSGNAIRCQICSRVFPREKSLQAHLRTHTGKSYLNEYTKWHVTYYGWNLT